MQNTWYTVLETTQNIRVLYVAFRHDTTDNVAKTLEVRATVDGIIGGLGPAACNNNTWYYAFLNYTTSGFVWSTTIYNVARYVDLRGKSVMIEIRQTTAPGANAELDGRVQYEVMNGG